MKTGRAPDTVFVRGFGFAEGLEWGFWLAAVIFWVVELDLSPLRLVALSLSIEIAVLLAESPTGVVADLRSRKWSIVISEFVIGLAFIAMVLTTNYWIVLVSLVIFGIGWTFRSGADLAWVTDELIGQRVITGENDADNNDADSKGADDDGFVAALLLRKQRLGLVVAVPTLLITIAIGYFTTVRLAAGAMGALHLLIAIYFVTHMTEDHFVPGQERGESFFGTLRRGIGVIATRPRLRILVVVIALVSFAAEAFDSLGFKHFLDTLDPDGAIPEESIVLLGALFLALAVAGFVVNVTTDYRLKRGTALARAVVACSVIAAIGGFISAASGVAIFIAVGFLVQDGSRNALFPLFEGWANRDAPSEVRATVHSLTGQFTSLGQLAGGIILGTLAEVRAIPISLAVASVVLLLAGAVAARGIAR